MSIPSISVIVPIYNVERYLEKCLNSLMNQSFDDYEVIIVNDGSIDRSKEIAEKYEAKYSNVVLLNQENKGAGQARNYGIEAAKGEYLLFVDSDDFIHKDTLKITYSKAIENKADMVVFGYTILSESGDIIKIDHGFENTNSTLSENHELIMCSPTVWNKLIKKEMFISSGIRFPSIDNAEDLNVLLKLYLHVKVFAFVDKSLYFYLKREGSVSNDVLKADKVLEIVDAVEDVLNYYKAENAYNEYKDELEFIAVYHAFYLGSLRVARINFKHPLMQVFRQYIQKRVPDYIHQKYLYRLGKSRKTVLKLLDKRHYFIVAMLLKIRNI